MIALTVVIPAYNEAGRLGPTLRRIAEYTRARDLSTELLVIDDGSRDGTAALAQAAGATVLSQPRNLGKGAAVRRGALAAAGERILVCDADLSAPIEEFAKLEAALDRGADIAIGSRRLARTVEIDQPWSRRLLGAGFRALVRHGLQLELRDTMCGFKLFTRRAARDLFARSRLDSFAFDVEVLCLARERYRVDEVAVKWSHARGSHVSLRREVGRGLLDVLWIRRQASSRSAPRR